MTRHLSEREAKVVVGVLAVSGLVLVWHTINLLWEHGWSMHVIHLVAISAAAVVTFAATSVVLLVMNHYRRRLECANAELRQAATEIKSLRGIIPICSMCKKIRNDKGFWQQVETYLSAHSDARFSHSLCDECIRKMYPGDADRIIEQLNQPG